MPVYLQGKNALIASKNSEALTQIPVLSKALNGIDSLLSIVQMPAGIPTATFAIGNAGATNAALFAVALLALSDETLHEKLLNYRNSKSKQALEGNSLVQARQAESAKHQVPELKMETT